VKRAEIAQRARSVIAQELGVAIDRVQEPSEFVADLKADSLDMARLPAALEEEFDVVLTDEQVAFCQTVGTAIDVIESNLENGSSRR
jgi:acyl carrier protein